MKLGEFVYNYRKANNLSMQAFGERCNLSRAYISILEKGKNPTTGKSFVPEIETLKAIALATGTDFNSLVKLLEDDTVKLNVKHPSSNYHYVPGYCAAGLPTTQEAVKQLPVLSVPDVVLGRHAGNKNILFIHANGDSMNRIFPDGALLAVLPIELIDLKNGEIVVFEDENHGISVKRYFRHDSVIVFRPDSTNDTFYDLTYKAEENKIRIIGKVVTYVVTL